MFHGDYRDYNLDRHNERVCAALDRSAEYPPDDEDKGHYKDNQLTLMSEVI